MFPRLSVSFSRCVTYVIFTLSLFAVSSSYAADALPDAGGTPATNSSIVSKKVVDQTVKPDEAQKYALGEFRLKPTIPGFLRSPYGPPSFGAPYGTTHAFGDWWGAQPWLQKHGIYFAVNIYEGISGNPVGGKRQSHTLAGQVGSTLDLQFEKLLNAGEWSRDLWLHMLVVNGNGQNLSRLMGDNGNQVQQIYGARGNVVAHLVWAYFEKSMLENRLDVSVGWIPPGTFFNNSPWVCSFMNVWLCGNVTPGKYLNGGRDWPSGNAGGVVRYMPRPDVYIMGGAFAVSPHSYNGGISGWSWAQSGISQVSTEYEVGWIPEFGRNHLIGHYKVGGMYDTSRYERLYEGYTKGTNLGAPTQNFHGRQESIWVMADQMLLRHGKGDSNGLVLAGYYNWASGKTSQINNHLVGAILDTGWYWHRPLDSWGINVQWASFSRSAIRAQEAAAAAGQALPGWNFGAPYGIQGHETIYEAFYIFHVLTGFNLQPDFQYVNHLGGSTRYKDAAVLSLAMTLAL